MNTASRNMVKLARVGTCASAVFAATVLSGCASSYHFSQLSGSRYFTTDIETYPVLITEVDGSPTATGIPVLVDAGRRTIVVQGPPTFVNLQETRSITLDVRPCTRYYLVAVKPNRLDNDFSVKIDFEEPVSGCTASPKAQR